MRHGDGIYQRGKSGVWYLDCRVKGRRYVISLGKGIPRTVALELATLKRSEILRGLAGIVTGAPAPSPTLATWAERWCAGGATWAVGVP